MFLFKKQSKDAAFFTYKFKTSIMAFIIKFKKWEETLDYVSCFSLHFFRALAASYVLYNRIWHSQA